MLRVNVYSRGERIGGADLYAEDPSMGVVSGQLQPDPAYAALRPEIGAVLSGALAWRDLDLEVRLENGESLRAVGGLMIEDLIDGPGVDKPILSVCGVDAPWEQFKHWFGDDPHYRAYFG